jgi:methionine sulfoxide reductase catalytic subunit
MPFVHRRAPWQRVVDRATSEKAYLNRRGFIAALGLGAVALTSTGCQAEVLDPSVLDNFGPVPPSDARRSIFPAKRNDAFTVPDRKQTDAVRAASYNNFYEFGLDKESPAKRSGQFVTTPWAIEIAGLVSKPQTIDLDDVLKRMPIQERLYRFRCVEAWSMVVPWVGFPMKALMDLVQPTADAKFVRFVTANRPEQMPGMREAAWYPWPYFEALTMAEAANDLTLLAVGLFGRPMPNQNGAPIRLVVPWKYGYKSIKSIVRIEFVADQPKTFWNELQPAEYGFVSNVDPAVPHPRWSQATERDIETGERIKTLAYNGYGELVASLYE